MAEQYTPGEQRIFYRSTGLREGLSIKVTLFDSKLNNNYTDELTEAKDNHENIIKGLYYFDYVFSNGVYVAYFHEFCEGKWVERGVQVYNIRKEPIGGSEGGFRPFLGDNVINT